MKGVTAYYLALYHSTSIKDKLCRIHTSLLINSYMDLPFIGILNDYLYWYNERRIKKSLGYLSPIEYRHRLGLVT